MRLPIGVPLLVTNVMVSGPKGRVWVDLILDTGAAFTALSRSILKIVGYDPAIASEREEVVTANGVIEVPKLRVDALRVGDVEAKEIDVICHDIPELVEARGLLGLSFLTRFRTVIDYRAGYLEIT